MVKTFLIISNCNFSCVPVAFFPVPACWTHSRKLLSCTRGALNHLSGVDSDILQRGTAWLPPPAGCSLACCLSGYFANSCSVCSSGPPGAPAALPRLCTVQAHDTSAPTCRTLCYPWLNFLRVLWSQGCAWTTPLHLVLFTNSPSVHFCPLFKLLIKAFYVLLTSMCNRRYRIWQLTMWMDGWINGWLKCAPVFPKGTIWIYSILKD